MWSTKAWLVARLCSSKRVMVARTSGGLKVVDGVTVPVRKPLPRVLNGTKSDGEVGQRGEHLGFGVAGPERVLALGCGDWVDGVRGSDGAGAGFGQAEVADLSGGTEFADVVESAWSWMFTSFWAGFGGIGWLGEPVERIRRGWWARAATPVRTATSASP
jgi:hypothetical protein